MPTHPAYAELTAAIIGDGDADLVRRAGPRDAFGDTGTAFRGLEWKQPIFSN